MRHGIKVKYSTRFVILISRYAIKIPISHRGYLQGKQERKIWSSYGHTGMLAPLVWEMFGIVCQRRCEPILCPTGLHYDLVIKCKEVIPEFDFKNCDLFNKQNWGVYKTNKVLLDYGISESISKMYKQKKEAYEKN